MSSTTSTHAAEAEAEQAVAARDWPAPGDHNRYLCGYTVRQWDGTRWSVPCSR